VEHARALAEHGQTLAANLAAAQAQASSTASREQAAQAREQQAEIKTMEAAHAAAMNRARAGVFSGPSGHAPRSTRRILNLVHHGTGRVVPSVDGDDAVELSAAEEAELREWRQTHEVTKRDGTNAHLAELEEQHSKVIAMQACTAVRRPKTWVFGSFS
jgi:hypothetical protein